MSTDTKTLSERPIPAEFMERAATLRIAVVWQSNASNEVIARALMAEHESKDARIAELTAFAEHLKLEAQCHASEARTANATVHEIYQVLSGATGEPGNWRGAEPARKFAARLAALTALLKEARQPLDSVIALDDEDAVEGSDLIAACQSVVRKIDAALAGSLLSKLTEATKP